MPSSPRPTVEIVAIGDELLSGEVVDSNSSFLDGALEHLGYRVIRHQTVPDERGTIVEAMRGAAARADLVLTTGGLGPTLDDLTYEALAAALGVELELHQPTFDRVRARLARRGLPLLENHRRQAMLPERVEVLDNGVGAAPALGARLDSTPIFVLPGVPREMRWLFEHQVGPRLPIRPASVRTAVRTAGLGESQVEAALGPVIAAHREVAFGFRARLFEVDVKLRGERADAVDAAARAVRATLGEAVVGGPEDSLEGAVLERLIHRGETVAVAESCTGGLVAKHLTDPPGASAAVVGGVVAYANVVKTALLGVDPADIERHGAVSEVVARAMAEGVRARLGATWGLSTTGVAGPGGGSADKPVGTVHVAWAGPGGTEAERLDLGERPRDVLRLATVRALLDRLRRRLGALDASTERL